MLSFYEKLDRAWSELNSMVCVGLDPDLSRFPEHLPKSKNSIFEFNREIIDATAPFSCAFKPQIAHYSAVSAEEELEKTIQYIKEKWPRHVVVLDAKRGDIGSTAEMYARESFERYEADCVTINPYLGEDSVKPFINSSQSGVFILCRTSNPGAKELQEKRFSSGEALFESVADSAMRWNENKNIGLVVGATAPGPMKQIRQRIGEMPLLVPGVGAQGGSVKDVVENGSSSKGKGLLINSSRGILYASNGKGFADAAAREAKTLQEAIKSFS